ncbi:MAG: GNAT family N-acetyltransferase, partial [Ghiorsea sp.]|nr:GNAT family N-acetyltransferase [Ghiorsea sp.]
MSLIISKEIELSPLRLLHAKPLLNLVNSSRENLEQYLSWVDSVQDLESAKTYILDRINSKLAGAAWHVIMFHGAMVGIFSIKSIDSKKRNAEIGYWLSNHVHGNGIINRIISNLNNYFKEDRNIRSLEFRCLEKNEASLRVARKAGAKYVMEVSDFIEVNGCKYS